MKPIDQFHHSMEDRLAAAHRFQKEVFPYGDIVCDTMDNDIMYNYHSFPDRILIIKNNILEHVGGPCDDFGLNYNVDNIFQWLLAKYPYNNKQNTMTNKDSKVSQSQNVIEKEVEKEETLASCGS